MPVAHSIAQVPAATCSAAAGNVSEDFLRVRGYGLRRMGEGSIGMTNGCAEIGPFRLITSTETPPSAGRIVIRSDAGEASGALANGRITTKSVSDACEASSRRRRDSARMCCCQKISALQLPVCFS